jgi:hypothetical protein
LELRHLKRAVQKLWYIDQGWTHLYFELPQTVGFTFGLLASINGAEGSFRILREALEGE